MPARTDFLPDIIVSGNTPFGFFDDKPKFRTDTEYFCVWSRLKHGNATLSVELDDLDLFAAMEESTSEYSSIANIYRAKDTLLDYLGTSVGSNIATSSTHYDDGEIVGAQSGYPIKTTNFLRRFVGAIADEIGTGGNYPMHTGTLTLERGKSIYSLRTDFTGTSGPMTGNQRYKIIAIYHDAPRAGLRYNAGSQYFENEFNMRSLPTNAMFQLFPVWPQLLYSLNFEFSNKMR